MDILIVEDEIAVALELEELLVSNGFQVKGIAATAAEAISMVEQLFPDLVLMDIKLNGTMDGIDAAAIILQDFGVSSIFLTGHSKDDLIKRASKVKPLGYILKPMNAPQILAAVKIACNMVHLNRQMEKQNRKKHLNDSLNTHLSEELSGLTFSELRVAGLIVQGMQNKQIAEKLNVSLHTIEWHRRHIRKKLGLLDRKENLMLHLLSLI